jgi:hypothetical protein
MCFRLTSRTVHFCSQRLLTGDIASLGSAGQLQINVGWPRNGLEWEERVGTWDAWDH